MKCAICDSVALSLHFGAPSCKLFRLVLPSSSVVMHVSAADEFKTMMKKEALAAGDACAAFFRRTVALDITYECITGKLDCEVNFERRMACKSCRYQKCIDKKMQRYLVQSKKGQKQPESLVCSTEHQNESPASPSSSCCSPPSTSCSMNLASSVQTDEIRKLNEHFFKMDSNLNKSRRMAFTNSRLLDIFSGVCKMPFEKRQLQPFDFRTYRGYQKQEYVMLFNYANTLPGFQDLSNASQNFLFRIACGVDFVISSSYYTNCIGMENNLLLNQDGTYIQMNPLPLLGDEPGIELMFAKKEEQEKYKNIIKPRVKSWQDFMPLYRSLDPSFEENAILKALCCWQTAHFNLVECDKENVRRQKSLLTQCMLKLCIDTLGEEEGPVRAGNIILFSSSICTEVMELVNSLIIMSFFEIMDCDPLINEILSTTTLFS